MRILHNGVKPDDWRYPRSQDLLFLNIQIILLFIYSGGLKYFDLLKLQTLLFVSFK